MKPSETQITVILSCILLVIFWVRSICFNPWLNIETCLRNPDMYHNQLITQLQEPRILQINQQGFVLGQKHLPPIQVLCDTSGLKENEFIGLTARFHKDGYLIAERIQISKNRRKKIWISILPVFLIGFMFFRYFRFDPGKRQFMVKTDA